MKSVIIFVCALILGGLLGCDIPPDNPGDPDIQRRDGYKSGTSRDFALLEKRLNERLDRIEADQRAMMLRFWFQPEGGK